jgi:hypothetical protein
VLAGTGLAGQEAERIVLVVVPHGAAMVPPNAFFMHSPAAGAKIIDLLVPAKSFLQVLSVIY